jgi:hypothetical protein
MGFAAGFQAGSQAVERALKRREEEQLKKGLAQEAARYDVTEGAYGPGLQENIQQLQGLREQDPAQAAAYDQAIAELTRRQSLTAPDYSVASGPTDFATRQEARQAAAPLRAEGLAGVYRQYGDVAQADALEARAFDQQRAIAREARDVAQEGRNVAQEGRNVRGFETQQAAAQQQGLLSAAQLTEIQRKQNLQAALDARLADINKQEFESPELRSQAVLGLVEELQGPQAAAQLRASYSQNELNDISIKAKKFDEGFRQSRAKGVIPALEWFDEQNTSFKLERDPKNPFRVIQVNTDNTRSVFADAKNERELGMIIDAKAKPGGFLELAKYDLDVKKADALVASEKAKASYYANAGGEKGLTKKVADVEASLGRKLTEPEKLTLFGLSAKPSDRPALSEADATARAKAIVESKEIDPDTKKPYKFNAALDVVRGTPPAPGTPAAARAQINALLGSGADPFAPPPTAARSATGVQSQTAPARNAPVEPNPYVDARGRPLAVTPAGAPSMASTAIPAAASAVESAVGSQAAATRYLQAKIARNEPLTATDRARAVQLGLVRQ